MLPSVISARMFSIVTPFDVIFITGDFFAQTVVFFPFTRKGLFIMSGPSNSPDGKTTSLPGEARDISSFSSISPTASTILCISPRLGEIHVKDRSDVYAVSAAERFKSTLIARSDRVEFPVAVVAVDLAYNESRFD